MVILKKYMFFLVTFVILVILFIINRQIGLEAIRISGDSIVSMFLLLPPIIIFTSLLDTWVSKDTLMKYMKKGSGLLGILIVFILGAIAAGPLYLAFPIAALLLKKGVRIQNVVFFLGVWVTAKLPVLIYETVSFGLTFTLIHISLGLLFFYFLGFFIEKLLYQGVEKVKGKITL